MSAPRCIAIHRILIIVLVAGVAAQAQTSDMYGASSGEQVARPVQSTNALSTGTTSVHERVAGARYGSLLGEISSGGALTEPVLVVPGKEMEPQAMEQVVEDLSVMSRIIQKNLAEDPALSDVPMVSNLPMMGALFKNAKTRWVFTGAGPDVFSRGGRPKPLYIGGYGAVFFLQVGIPLLPPPETPQPAATPDKVDPVWAEAKRSLLEPPSAGVQFGQPDAAPEPYSLERIEALKTQLIAAMKYATNIRALEPTDRLVLVVQGTAAVTPNASQDADPFGKTVLTLRATRADIELSATDKLDRKQFEQRVQTITY